MDETLDAGGKPVATPGETDPVRIGRFVVLSRIGVGGMGIVYAAFDQQLDRKVAIKLLHAEQPQARHRLLREAQAMAKVSHPNVVAVYEVGTHNGHVYLAMELVRGKTLSDWLDARPRSVDAILRVFVEAGTGLATAHAAGIVHRDFKPDNVLVGDDERVRVVDFGLARPDAVGPPLKRRTVIPGSIQRDDRLSTDLPDDGQLLGTPAYMAPEAYAGTGIDARSDQFSFCVALFEAVFGKRPFSGGTLAELSVAVVSGQLNTIGRSSAGSDPLRKALMRGLKPDPADRFASMAELLAALAPKRRRRRAPWLIAGASALGIAGVGVWALGHSQSGLPECEVAPVSGAAWDEAAKDQLRERFVALAPDRGSEYADQAGGVLDEYLESLTTAQAYVCGADVAADPQALRLAATQRACLDARRREFDGLLVTMNAEAGELLHGVNRAVRALHPVQRCLDPKTSASMLSAPSDDATLEAAMAVRLQLGYAWAINDRGRFVEAHRAAREARRAAAEVDDQALQAQALFALSYVTARAGRPREGDTLGEEAVIAAESAGDEHRRALAMSMLAIAALIDNRNDEAADWKRRADAAAIAFGPDEELEAWRVFYEGTDPTNEPDVRLKKFERALLLYTKLAGPESQEVVGTQHNLAGALSAAGRKDEALLHLQQRAETMERLHGPTSTHLLFAYQGIGQRLIHEHSDPARARPWVERAEFVAETAGPSAHRAWSFALGLRGDLELASGKYDLALEAFEAALRHVNAGLDDVVRAATLLERQGVALVMMERSKDAMRKFEAAEATLADRLNRRDLLAHTSYPRLIIGWAYAAVDSGDPGQARELVERVDAARRTGPAWDALQAWLGDDAEAKLAAIEALNAWEPALGLDTALKTRALAWFAAAG